MSLGEGTYCSVGTMPDTPPAVTASLVPLSVPFVVVLFAEAATVPVVPAPLGIEVGREGTEV